MLLAFGGIISAFIIILLWLSSVLTFNTIAILSLASFLIGVVLIEGGVKNSLICYGAVGLISLVLPIDRINVMAFILFFGYYPILKSLIEKINKLSFEIIIKLMLFLILAFSGVYGYFKLFSTVSDVIPLWAVALMATMFFGIFDYALSLLFDYYVRKIRPKIKR